jgi:hypothetical protein
MRFLFCGVVAFFVLTGAAVAATSGYHFTSNGYPLCTDIGSQVQCTASIAGLGNGDVLGTVSAQGTEVGVTCTSPGGNQAPGQNPAIPTSASGTKDFGNPKNGRLDLTVTTDAPTITPAQAGCPNSNWTAAYSDVVFTNYTFTITQGGTTLYTCSGSFGSGSTNGQTSRPTCS